MAKAFFNNFEASIMRLEERADFGDYFRNFK
jgi:hypothetical protein